MKHSFECLIYYIKEKTNQAFNNKLNLLLLYHTLNLQRGTITFLMTCLQTNERKLNTHCVGIVDGVTTSNISQR